MNNYSKDEIKQDEALFHNDIMISDEYIISQINEKPYLRKSFYNFVENYSDGLESTQNALPQFGQIKQELQQKIRDYRQQNDAFYEQQEKLQDKFISIEFHNLIKNNFDNFNSLFSLMQKDCKEFLQEEEDKIKQMQFQKTQKSIEVKQIQQQFEQNKEILIQLQHKHEKIKEIEKIERKKELQNQRYMKSQQKIIYQKILESARNLQVDNEGTESGKLHILSPISQEIIKISQSQTREPQTTKMQQQPQNLFQSKKFQNIKENLKSSIIDTEGKQNQRSRNQQLQELNDSKQKSKQSQESNQFLSRKVSDILKDKEIINTLQNIKMLEEEDDNEQSQSNEQCNVDLDEADELNSDIGKQSQNINLQNQNDINNTGKFNDLMDQIFQKYDSQQENQNDNQSVININDNQQFENIMGKPGKQIQILSNQYLQNNDIIKINPYQEDQFSKNNINSQSISTKEGSKRSIANKNINQVSNIIENNVNIKGIENQINQCINEQIMFTMKIEHLEQDIKAIDELINVCEQRTKQFVINKNLQIQELSVKQSEFNNQFNQIKNIFKDEIDQLSSQNRDHDEPLSWQSIQKQLKILDGVEKIYNLKTEAWENEIRSLQDKCQKRQFQIDHLKKEVATQVFNMASNNQFLKNSLKINDYQSQLKNEESGNVMENILKNDAIQNLDRLQKQVAQLYKQVFIHEQNRQLQAKVHEERRTLNNSIADGNSTIYKHKHLNNILYDEISQIIDFNLIDFFNQNQVPSSQDQFLNARNALNINSQNIQKIVAVLSNLASENDMLYDLVDQLAGISLSNYYEFSEYLRQEIGVEEEEIESHFIKQTRNKIKNKIKQCLHELTQFQKDIIYAHSSHFFDNNTDIEKQGTNNMNKQKDQSKNIIMPYINRYCEMINEAREMFVQDLSQLQDELHKSRKILIQLFSKCEKYSSELKDQIKENTRISTQLTSTTANQKDLQSQFEKLNLELNSLKSDSQILQSQNQNLELLNQNKEKHIQQLCDDMFKIKNQNSQLEQSIFENQQEVNRSKNQVIQNKQQFQQLEDQNNELKIQIQNLQIENQDLQDEQSGDVFEAILRDVSNWMNEIQQYNSNFLENMDLVNQLNFMISDDHGEYFYGEEDDSKLGLNVINQEQIVKIVKKLAGHAENFEPLRQRMKLNIYMIEKKIHEYRMFQQSKRNRLARKNYDDLQTVNDWKSSGRKNNLTVRSSYKRQIDSPSPQKLKNIPGSAMLRNQNKRSIKRKLTDQSRNHSKKKSSDGEVEILEKNDRIRNSEKNQTFTKFMQTERFYQDGLNDNKLTSVNQDLRLRLDMCHDDIFELEKKLKIQSIQLIKLEDYKIKFMQNQENFNKLKSRFKIVKNNLEEIIKNNGQNILVEEIQRLLDMIETFPNIAQHNLTQFASFENASMISQYRANQKAPKINRYSNKSQIAIQRQNIAKSEYNKINKDQIVDDNNIQQLLNMSGSDNKESSRGIYSEILPLKNQKTDDLTKRDQINIIIRQPSSNQNKHNQDEQNESQNLSISLNNISKDLAQFNKNRNNVSSFGLRQATFGVDVLDPLMQQAKMLSSEVVNSIKNELLNKQIQKVMIESSTQTDSIKQSDFGCQTDSTIKIVNGSNIGKGITKIQNLNKSKNQNKIHNIQNEIFDQMPSVKISKLDSQQAFQSNWQSLSNKNRNNELNFQTYQQPTKIYQSPTKVSNFKSESKPEMNKQSLQKQNFLIQPSQIAQQNDQNSLQKQYESEQINIIINQTYNQETKNSPISQASELVSNKESIKTSKNSSINSKASKYLSKNKQTTQNESHMQSKMSLRQAEKSNLIDQQKLDELDFKFDIIQEDLNSQNLIRNGSKLYQRRDSNLANFDNQILKKQLDLQNLGLEDSCWLNEQQSEIKSSPKENSRMRKKQDMLIIEESAEQEKLNQQSNKKQEVTQYQDFIDQNNISRKSSILAIQGQNISINLKQNTYESQKSRAQEIQSNINQISQIDQLTNEGNEYEDNEQSNIPELNEHFFQINDEEEQMNQNTFENGDYNDTDFMDIDNQNYFQRFNREEQINKNNLFNKIRDPHVETIQEEMEGEDQSYNDNNHKSSINTFKESKKTLNPLNSYNNNEDINSHNFSIASNQNQSNRASKHKPKYSVGNVLPNLDQKQRVNTFIDRQQNNFVYDSQSSNSAEVVKNVEFRLNKIVNNQVFKQQNFSIRNTSSLQESEPLENVESLNNSNHENYTDMKKLNILNTLKNNDQQDNREQIISNNGSFIKSSKEKQQYNDQFEKLSKINDESSFKSFIN